MDTNRIEVSNVTRVEFLKSSYSRIVTSLFSKHIRLKPSTDGLVEFITDAELMSRLHCLSVNLNELRKTIPSDRLDDWRKHTSFTHPLRGFTRERAKSLCHIQNCTQAFFKFYEILTRFSHLCFPSSETDNAIRSLHLCESPGAFISALDVYLKLEKKELSWYWKANSLNPHYEWNSPFEMFLDDELIINTYSNWLFGPDKSGDIFKWSTAYIDSITERIGKFSLITADGSIYCQDNPAEQESITLPLLEKEVDIALSLLQTHGTFIVKMYTTFLDNTIALINRLLTCFEELHYIKPSCSKPGNSEVYLLCARYKSHGSFDCESKLHASYQKALFECSKFFVEHQMEMIKFNIATFGKASDFQSDLNDFIAQKKMEAARHYDQQMFITKLEKLNTEIYTSSFRKYVYLLFSCFRFLFSVSLEFVFEIWKHKKIMFIESLEILSTWKFYRRVAFINFSVTQIVFIAKIVQNMDAISDMLKGVTVAPQEQFEISACWNCDCCHWPANFCLEQWDIEDVFEVGEAPDPKTNMKHTLFLQPKVMALLKFASSVKLYLLSFSLILVQVPLTFMVYRNSHFYFHFHQNIDIYIQNIEDIFSVCNSRDSNCAEGGSERSVTYGNSLLEINASKLKCQLEWILFLEELLQLMRNNQKVTLKLTFPRFSFLLTRFSASFMAMFSFCYKKVVLICSRNNSSERFHDQLICEEPRMTINYVGFLRYLSILKGNLAGDLAKGLHIYRFVPELQFKCEFLYTTLLRYNSYMARRLLLVKYKL
ncbi:unnamed protein product [Thelazia callipaeda]|uniref:Cap-specific mRNA (nucleoside-2'-O-)-methyltransferase 2 n=1 Tax=Thelazia callipaeda TaxID=103827 RepID=A0A0N5CN62_THECL|nr:unnamed protein product [Thelazia callipaeda]